MIEVGLKAALHIREERLSQHPDASRVLYISDIHLRRRLSAAISEQVLDAVSRCAPDLVLYPGALFYPYCFLIMTAMSTPCAES